MRLSLFAVLLVVPVALADDDPEPRTRKVVRELKIEGLREGGGRLEVMRFTTKEEARKLGLAKAAYEKLMKQIDFKKECLVYLRWAGSSGDKVEMKDDQGLVTFTRVYGDASDRKTFARLFVLPLKAEYKVVQ